jgi:PleD family two-component response regulator
MTSNKKVLIIDDEKMNIMALAHFLKPRYELIVAVDGISGFEAAEKHKPDIILLDVIMPEMSGFDVIVKLKESAATKNIPVIFLTGLDNAVDEEKGMLLGAVDYITKPFNRSLVMARIETNLKIFDCVSIIKRFSKLLENDVSATSLIVEAERLIAQ